MIPHLFTCKYVVIITDENAISPKVKKLQESDGSKTFQFWHSPLCGAVKSRLPALFEREELRSRAGGTERKRAWEFWAALWKFYLHTNLTTVKKRGGGIFLSLFFLPLAKTTSGPSFFLLKRPLSFNILLFRRFFILPEMLPLKAEFWSLSLFLSCF